VGGQGTSVGTVGGQGRDARTVGRSGKGWRVCGEVEKRCIGSVRRSGKG